MVCAKITCCDLESLTESQSVDFLAKPAKGFDDEADFLAFGLEFSRGGRATREGETARFGLEAWAKRSENDGLFSWVSWGVCSSCWWLCCRGMLFASFSFCAAWSPLRLPFPGVLAPPLVVEEEEEEEEEEEVAGRSNSSSSRLTDREAESNAR